MAKIVLPFIILVPFLVAIVLVVRPRKIGDVLWLFRAIRCDSDARTTVQCNAVRETLIAMPIKFGVGK